MRVAYRIWPLASEAGKTLGNVAVPLANWIPDAIDDHGLFASPERILLEWRLGQCHPICHLTGTVLALQLWLAAIPAPQHHERPTWASASHRSCQGACLKLIRSPPPSIRSCGRLCAVPGTTA
jgi:hypothetical protein